MTSASTAEARLTFFAAGPMERPPRGSGPEAERAPETPTSEVPIKVYGKAQAMLDQMGATIKEGTISVAGKRLSFDRNTKEVGVFAHKDQLFIEVTNHKGPNETVIIGKNGEFRVVKAERDEKRKERPLTSVVDVKDARKWVKELKINGEVVKQLEDAKKAGLVIEDNYSKSNGLVIFKNRQRVGEVVVFMNPSWPEELSRLLEQRFFAKAPDQ